ncbi:arylamine N-acetyltransferase [Candidatus Uabimicrobium amorphum]|uniref:Uncharacterized protein n=1 Tax=Uabimicrobium amorphum TaxID=2596890 RepID=A0A5S9ITZ1_UABAM|nr:arylamine N-acetyltransferase [Candidatus Uabimicrobium amorphum]BBM87110.1 hypothetical protein UABAM_05513 [Candidatus Uabimicrobium amorphum]
MTSINYVESLMLNKFKTEPFHNLYLLSKTTPKTLIYGGTCSDKTLSFLNTLKSLGIEAKLHSSLINNQNIHRLVAVNIEGQTYFADVGNGWPSIKLFPKHYEVRYTCYGITYRSEIKPYSLKVYQTRRGEERLSTEIPFESKNEQQIMDDIKNRFDGSVEYPFSTGLRFSQVVDDKFLFLRDDTLLFFCECDKPQDITNIDREKASDIIKKHFQFDVRVLFEENQVSKFS